MAKMYGKYLFAGVIRVTKDAPVFHVAPTNEVEWPYRKCYKSLIIKLLNKEYSPAIVVGLWRKSDDNDEVKALFEAVKGEELGVWLPDKTKIS